MALLFNLKKIDIERIKDVVEWAEHVVWVGLAQMDSVFQELLSRKLDQVCKDAEHPLRDAILAKVVSVVG